MYWYFGGLAVLSLISQIEGAIIIGLFAGIVPGIALWASNTLLVYSLAALPAWLVMRSPSSPSDVKVGIAASIVLIAAVAVAPGLVARHDFDQFARQLHAQDISQPARVVPRTFRIPYEGSSVKDTADCGKLCQQLLFNGGADAVFIHNAGVWRFSLEKRGRCPTTHSPIQPANAVRLVRGDCLIETQGDADTADVAVHWVKREKTVIPKDFARCSASSFALWTAEEPRTLQIEERVGGELVTAERRTEVKASVPPLPFWIGFGGCGESKVVPKLAAWEAASQSVSIPESLARRYRINIESSGTAAIATPPQTRESRREISLGLAEDVRRILERGYATGETISDAEVGILRKVFWAIQDHAAAQKREYDEEEIALVRLAVRQRALTNYAGIERGAFRHRNALATLLPDMVERLEAPIGGKERENFRWDLSNIMRELPADELRPYASRLGAILDDPARAIYANSIIERWGEISDAPVPKLTNLMIKPPSPQATESVYRGLCRVNAATDPELARLLLAKLGERHYSYPKPAVVALIRAGRRGELAERASKDSSIAHTLRFTPDNADASKC